MEYEDHEKALGCLRDLQQPLQEARSKVAPQLMKSASAGWLCLCIANALVIQGSMAAVRRLCVANALVIQGSMAAVRQALHDHTSSSVLAI